MYKSGDTVLIISLRPSTMDEYSKDFLNKPAILIGLTITKKGNSWSCRSAVNRNKWIRLYEQHFRPIKRQLTNFVPFSEVDRYMVLHNLNEHEKNH